TVTFTGSETVQSETNIEHSAGYSTFKTKKHETKSRDKLSPMPKKGRIKENRKNSQNSETVTVTGSETVQSETNIELSAGYSTFKRRNTRPNQEISFRQCQRRDECKEFRKTMKN